MQANIDGMAEFFREGDVKLRPHFKAHKTLEIARRQLAAGSCTGLTCATVAEAEAVADICDDILIANEIVGAEKTARLAALVTRGVDMKVAVDSAEGLALAGEAAVSAGVEIGVLIDVNVGMPRCGVAPDAAVELAARAAKTAGVRLRGLMGYEGHAVGIPERDKREKVTREAMEGLLSAVSAMREAGLPCEIVSAGGTGSYDITGRIEGITEVQPGSYALMDTAYAKLASPFRQAIWVPGTVISRPAPNLCVADSGHKACTEDHGNPEVAGVEGASVLFLSDEHASITLPRESALAVGDRIRLTPSHIDPTINLHDVIYVIEGDRVTDVWPVTARGYAEQRR